MRGRWHGQDAALVERDRLVEECVRMLAGRQWDVYSPVLGQFVDVTRWMSDAEKRWRQRPVLNVLEHWFMLTQARLTENPPLVGWQPATGDRSDAMLAEALDTIVKTVWGDCAMDERFMRLTAWQAATGEGYLKLRVDYTAGPEQELRRDAVLEHEGQEVLAEGVPFGADGRPLARLLPRSQPTTTDAPRAAAIGAGGDGAPGDPELQAEIAQWQQAGADSFFATEDSLPEEVIPSPGAGDPAAAVQDVDASDADWEWESTGEPHRQRQGELRTDVLGPLEVRAEWGPGVAWEEKRWAIHRSYPLVAEARARYPHVAAQLKPDALGGGGGLAGHASLSGGYLERVLFGPGYFGQASATDPGAGSGGAVGMGGATGDQVDGDGRLCIDEMWEKPDGASLPEGRLLVVAPYQEVVIFDGPRPANFTAAGPIRRATFVDLPGRPAGSTPLEQMLSAQRAYNRGWAQILEHRARCCTPILLVHEGAGIDVDQISAAPGTIITHASDLPNPIQYLVPPPLPADVWRVQEQLLQHLFMIGSIHGAEGTSPTESASGELVSQLRFNADRFISPAAKALAECCAGWAEDVRAWLPVVWTEDRTIATAGEDGVIRTLTVKRDLFQGSANAVPDLESALPESRGERQARARQDWQEGVFGEPLTPQARRAYMDLARYPHANRLTRPGGAGASTAQQNLALLAQGAKVGSGEDQVPVFPWYDFDTLIPMTEEHMSSPEFKGYEAPVIAEFVKYRRALYLASVAKQQEMQQLQAMLAQSEAALKMRVQASVAPQQAQLAAAQGEAEGAQAAAAHAANPQAQAEAETARQQAEASIAKDRAQQPGAPAKGPKRTTTKPTAS